MRYFKSIFVLATFFSLFTEQASAQGINNLWTLGYSENYQNYGGSNINFINNSPDTSRAFREIDMRITSANICDSAGQLLFCTNGFDVSDLNGQAMPNGHGLHGSSSTTTWASSGNQSLQGCIILPNPGNLNQYYIIHEAEDLWVILNPDGAVFFPEDLYFSIVDMSLNAGLGDVINKNTILLHDTIAKGQITACKHANGRDWWVIIPSFRDSVYHKYLLSPNGFQLMNSQQIGIRDYTSGQGSFSPDGNYYAYFSWFSGLEVFNFDRCSGNFSNPQLVVPVDTMQTGWGMAFSPDSKKIYVSTGFFIHQFDLNAPSLSTSNRVVAIWDGYYEGFVSTMFGLLQLAPDGKIYISTGNSTHYLHCIENPDIIGIGCNLVQRAVQVPTWYYNSLPNHPNYFLGSVTNSVCDSITGIAGQMVLNDVLSIYPNPVIQGNLISIEYPTLSGSGGIIVLLDINGKILTEEKLPPWSQVAIIKIPQTVNGLLVLRILSEKFETSSRVVVTKE